MRTEKEIKEDMKDTEERILKVWDLQTNEQILWAKGYVAALRWVLEEENDT